MVLKPCEVGTGEQPNCYCGPLGRYQPETKNSPGQCICNENAFYDTTNKTCYCKPGYVVWLNPGGKQYCIKPEPPPPSPPQGENQSETAGKVLGYAFAGAFGLAFLLYAVPRIGDNVGLLMNYFGQPPPIVAGVVAPVAPIVPGIVMQNNPMLNNGAA